MPCRKKRQSADNACAISNIYRFIEPVTLFLLKQSGGSYGYELQRMLAESSLTNAAIDGGSLYRTLQRLEDNGFVASEWETAQNGPPRHKYRLTDSGEEHLREWVVVLDQLRSSMEGFVKESYRLFESKSS